MPTSNAVPSSDPSDLLFNAQKLDETVNSASLTFTDRLGAPRKTMAGIQAAFDAQLADAESDLNVYRADAAASAAEALGYLQTYRATSYGALASDPATDPLGNPPTVGDEYFNTTAKLLKRFNGATWQASDINTANLAAPSGSSLVGYLPSTGAGDSATTVQAVLRDLEKVAYFISAQKAGLTKWAEIKKPPYSNAEYEQAYNNGINLAAAIKAANDAGYSKIVLERGNYPFCYINMDGSSGITSLEYSCQLTGLSNLDFDGNGSTLFVIFDSVNRSPYDKGTVLKPYELPGGVFYLKDNTNLFLHGFSLMGDQWMRSWVAGENLIEQTYGVMLATNNINTKIDITGAGFRGDVITGASRAIAIASLDNNWSAGGIDATGNEVVEVGSYRSPRIDLIGKTIYRNAVQIYTSGYLRAAEFRNDKLRVFFYNTNGDFISAEDAYQCEFIYLPVNCRYVQFVAYEDERTDPVVGYGVYLYLGSGASEKALVNGEYYANHRGAISNLCNNTIVDANIHDNGTNKYGFPDYGVPTRYGVNFEDTYVSSLTVKGVIRNGIQAVLCNAKTLKVHADIKNMVFSAVAAFATFEVIVSDCNIDNVGILFNLQSTSRRKKNRLINLTGNTVKNAYLYGDYSSDPDIFLNIYNNVFAHSYVSLVGNQRNLAFDNNKFTSLKGRYVSVCTVNNAISVSGNTFVRSINVPRESIGWAIFNISGIKTNSNVLIHEQTDLRSSDASAAATRRLISGTEFILNDKFYEVRSVSKSGDFIAYIDNVDIKNCIFNTGSLNLGSTVTADYLCNSNYVLDDVKFKNGAYVNIQRRENIGPSAGTLVIKDSMFDLTNSTYVLYTYFAWPLPAGGTFDIKFINCTFTSDVPKSIKLFTGWTNGVTVSAKGCRFINVTNIDSITTITS